MNVRQVLFVGALVLGTGFYGHRASAAIYNVDFTGADNNGAVTADMSLNVSNGTVISGTGTITEAVWGTAQMSFLSSPTLATTYEFNGGTELFNDDNAFPIDGNGLAFNVGTAPNVGSQYQTGGGFGIWSTGGDTYQIFLGDTVNGGSVWTYGNGTASVSAVPVPGALTLFGAGLVGLGAIAWGKGRKKNAV